MARITPPADFSWFLRLLDTDTAAGVFIGLLLLAGLVMTLAPVLLSAHDKAERLLDLSTPTPEEVGSTARIGRLTDPKEA